MPTHPPVRPRIPTHSHAHARHARHAPFMLSVCVRDTTDQKAYRMPLCAVQSISQLQARMCGSLVSNTVSGFQLYSYLRVMYTHVITCMNHQCFRTYLIQVMYTCNTDDAVVGWGFDQHTRTHTHMTNRSSCAFLIWQLYVLSRCPAC